MLVSNLLPRTSGVWPRFISRARRIHTDKQHVSVPQPTFGLSLIFYYYMPIFINSEFLHLQQLLSSYRRYAVAQLDEALRYKPGGHRFGFDGVIGIFHFLSPSGRTLALESTQSLIEK